MTENEINIEDGNLENGNFEAAITEADTVADGTAAGADPEDISDVSTDADCSDAGSVLEEISDDSTDSECAESENAVETDSATVEESGNESDVSAEDNSDDDNCEVKAERSDESAADSFEDDREDSGKARKPEHPEAAIEAILFAYGNSVSSERLCETLSLTEEELEEAVENLKKSYEEAGRGITITRLEDSYQLGTKSEYYDYLVRLAKHPKRYSLTDTVIETLSIIAYKQPVTRGEIERIRGVSSDHAINRLIEYELIEEVGRLDAPGKPLLFGTTEQFLRAFGVDSLKDLPEMSAELKEEFKEQAEAEAGVEKDDDEGVIVDV